MLGLALCSSCLCGLSVHSSPLITLRLFFFSFFLPGLFVSLMLIWLRSDGRVVESGDSLDHVVIYPDLSLLVTRQKKNIACMKSWDIREGYFREERERCVDGKGNMGWKD